VSLDDLLIWMSARGQGSWPQFRAAVEQFHVAPENGDADTENAGDITANDLPLYQCVRLNLQRLAHVEFASSTTSSEWRVVPPSLAISDHGGRPRGVFCGARFPALMDRMSRLKGVDWETQEIAGMPHRIRLFGPDVEAVRDAAKTLGVRAVVQAPVGLLSAIPPVDDPRSRFRADPPGGPGWVVERFVSSGLRWTARHPKENRDLEPRDIAQWQTGLYRFRMKFQRFHFLRWRGGTFGVPVQVGKYAILRHERVRKVVSYNREKAVLSFPAICRPPLLIERALVLCSGLLPRFDEDSRRLEYTEVPLGVAQLAAGLLRQEIGFR